MSPASGGLADLPVRWNLSARREYYRSLDYILLQDPYAADLVEMRVAYALKILSSQPMIGTPMAGVRKRRFPIPKTGHMIEYRVFKTEILITRWARQVRRR